MLGNDVRELDRRAVLASVEVVSLLSKADLPRPTPCAAWTLADLVAHMTTQHRGFTAAAQGDGADPAHWQVAPLGADPVGAYARAADGVLSAFAAPGVLDREFALPELSATSSFAGARAVGFHFVDYVVHGWDVARSLGVGFDPDADLLDAAWRIVSQIPDGPQRLEPGAAFGPAVRTPEGAGPLELVLTRLGRSPSWPEA